MFIPICYMRPNAKLWRSSPIKPMDMLKNTLSALNKALRSLCGTIGRPAISTSPRDFSNSQSNPALTFIAKDRLKRNILTRFAESRKIWAMGNLGNGLSGAFGLDWALDMVRGGGIEPLSRGINDNAPISRRITARPIQAKRRDSFPSNWVLTFHPKNARYWAKVS